MSVPKIAILLAVYNGMEWLQVQLNSILNQADVDVTIFVSIDPSTDASEVFCREMSVQYQNIVVLSDAGKFGSAAKNFFRLIRDVDFSNFDYVSFADHDDIWFEDKLAKAVDKIIETKSDAYSSNVIAFWDDGREKVINKAQPQQQWDYMFESAGPGCTFVMSKALAIKIQDCLLANKEKCQRIALHDWFIYAFARSRGFKWLIDNQSYMRYRQHGGNAVGANVGAKASFARWHRLRGGWLSEQALLISEILGYSHAWPIEKLNRYGFFDRLALIINISKLRRRLRDRLALAWFLLFPLKK